jgi:hypothetical protein
MLVATVARAVAPGIEPRSVVVAIVGGTMLTLALTRPRLRWVERLTEDSESHRLWAERALTIFAFAMAGYAWTALFLVLHKQLDSEIDAILRTRWALISAMRLFSRSRSFAQAERSLWVSVAVVMG